MKKFFALFIMMCGITTAMAQNEAKVAILQHGDETTVFNGSNALVDAHEAAVDGDMITLSSGVYNATTITKSVAIYGTGFEDSEANETAVAKINGDLRIGESGKTVKDVRLEGLYFANAIRGDSDNKKDQPIEGLVITHCYVAGSIIFNSNISNVMISESVLNEVRGTQATIATNLSIFNCHISSCVHTFSPSSTVMINNCIILGGIYDNTNIIDNYCAFSYFNTIFTYTGRWSYPNGTNSDLTNCLMVSGINIRGTTHNCYTEIALADVFADAENANYTPERTFELKQPTVWVGTDGSPIGIIGGSGWSKIPGTPLVNNLQLQVDGLKLKVTYDAKVR